MEKELLDPFTNFVNWCIELNVDYQKNPEEHEGFSPFRYTEIDLSSRDKDPYSFQRKKYDLFNAELIPELIKGNDKKISGNIFTYSIKRGFQESFDMTDLKETVEIQNFAMNYLPQKYEFNEIVKLLDSEFPIEKNTSKTVVKTNQKSNKRKLEYFIHEVLTKHSRKELDDDLLEQYIIDFLNQMSGKPPETLIIKYIHGIHLFTPEIELLPNIVLKYFNDDDFAEIGRYGAFPYDYSLYEPDFVLKCRYKGEDKDTQKNIERNIVSCLQLYKTGSILVSHRLSFVKDMRYFHRLEFEENYNRWTQNVLNFFAYDIHAEEGEEIKDFVSTICPKLNFTKTEHYDQIISLSLERYQWALMERTDIDRKMLFAVMGFEPLLKTNKDTKNIGSAIAKRLSIVLQHFGYKQKEVNKDYTKAYNYRNKITHGGYMTQSDFEKMINLFPRILDYLRMVLIAYLVGYNSKNKFFLDLKNSQKGKSNKLRDNLTIIHNKFPNCFKKTRSTRFFSKSLLDVKKMFEEIEKNIKN